MKAVAATLILAALVFASYLNRIGKYDGTTWVKDPLRTGETNPPLRRIGETVPPEGTRVWLYTNCRPSYTILDTTDLEVYRVRFSDGTETTVNPEHITRSYMEVRK